MRVLLQALNNDLEEGIGPPTGQDDGLSLASDPDIEVVRSAEDSLPTRTARRIEQRVKRVLKRQRKGYSGSKDN